MRLRSFLLKSQVHISISTEYSSLHYFSLIHIPWLCSMSQQDSLLDVSAHNLGGESKEEITGHYTWGVCRAKALCTYKSLEDFSWCQVSFPRMFPSTEPVLPQYCQFVLPLILLYTPQTAPTGGFPKRGLQLHLRAGGDTHTKKYLE